MPKRLYALTIRGRKSGKLFSTPVTLMFNGGKRYLVSPYGDVNWVKNARQAGEVMVEQGSKKETLKIREVSAHDAAPILKQYLQNVTIVRSYFEVDKDAPVEAFEPTASAHPVFELIP